MFTRNHRLAAALGLLALAVGNPCHAQEGGPKPEDIASIDVSYKVVVDGGNALEQQVNHLVQDALSQRLYASAQDKSVPRVVGVELQRQGARVSDNVEICNLVVYYQIVKRDLPALKEETKRKLWDKGRQQIEAALQS